MQQSDPRHPGLTSPVDSGENNCCVHVHVYHACTRKCEKSKIRSGVVLVQLLNNTHTRNVAMITRCTLSLLVLLSTSHNTAIATGSLERREREGRQEGEGREGGRGKGREGGRERRSKKGCKRKVEVGVRKINVLTPSSS